MKRYDPSWPDNNYGGDMFEEPDGEWVRYEDAQTEIDRLRKELNNALSAVHWRDLELDRLRGEPL